MPSRSSVVSVLCVVLTSAWGAVLKSASGQPGQPGVLEIHAAQSTVGVGTLTEEQVAALMKDADAKADAEPAAALALYFRVAAARPEDYMVQFRIAVVSIKAQRKRDAQAALDRLRSLLKNPSETQGAMIKQLQDQVTALVDAPAPAPDATPGTPPLPSSGPERMLAELDKQTQEMKDPRDKAALSSLARLLEASRKARPLSALQQREFETRSAQAEKADAASPEGRATLSEFFNRARPLMGEHPEELKIAATLAAIGLRKHRIAVTWEAGRILSLAGAEARGSPEQLDVLVDLRDAGFDDWSWMGAKSRVSKALALRALERAESILKALPPGAQEQLDVGIRELLIGTPASVARAAASPMFREERDYSKDPDYWECLLSAESRLGESDRAIRMAGATADRPAKKKILGAAAQGRAEVGDAKGAIRIAGLLEVVADREAVLCDVACRLARSGAVDEAGKLAAEMKPEASGRVKLAVAQANAERQAQLGNGEAALAIARSIEEASDRAGALASAAVSASDPVATARLLDELKSTILSMPEIDRSKALTSVVIRIAWSKKDVPTASASLRDLFSLARSAYGAKARLIDTDIKRLAKVQVRCGDLDGASTTLDLLKAKAVAGKYPEYDTLRHAKERWECGDKEGARTAFAEASRLLRERSDAEPFQIVEAQAEVGAVDEALHTLGQVRRADLRAQGLARIAVAQCFTGDAAGARRTFEAAHREAAADIENRVYTLELLATAHADAGDSAGVRSTLEEALAAARAIRTDSVRGDMMSGVAETQTKLEAPGYDRHLGLALDCDREAVRGAYDLAEAVAMVPCPGDAIREAWRCCSLADVLTEGRPDLLARGR